MLYIILAWIFWFLFCFNIGYFVLGLLFPKKQKDIDFFYNFWFGLFFLITVLQFISLFTPLNGKVLITLTAVNVLLLALNIKRKKPDFKVLFKGLLKKLDYRKVLLYGTLVLVLAFLANQPVVWYDTLLYHFNSVKWLNEYGTVKGLANIHIRLGINNATFILGAIMDNWIFHNSSAHVLNSVLLFVMLLQFLSYLMTKPKNNLLYVFTLFSALISSMFIEQISSFSTDFGVMIFVLLSVFYTFRFFENGNILLALPFYVLAATTKYSYFIALVIFLLFTLIWHKKKLITKENVLLLLAIFFFFVSFIIRNFFLSGWPFFPLAIFGIGFRWQAPVDLVKDFSETVTAWARLPGPNYTSMMNASFFKWFPVWFVNNRVNMGYLASVPFLLLAYVVLKPWGINSENRAEQKVLNFLILANVAALIFTFITGPDFRFMNIFIYVVIALILSFFLKEIVQMDLFRNILILLVIFVISGNLLRNSYIVSFSSPLHPYKDESASVKEVYLKYKDQSFKILTPVRGDQCGNSQIPCTPYVTRFKMANVEDISKGFIYTTEPVLK